VGGRKEDLYIMQGTRTFLWPVAIGVLLLLIALIPTAAPAVPKIPDDELHKARVYGDNPTFDPETAPGVGTTDRKRCTTSGNPEADIDISCDDPVAPDNELAIVADPENPDHLLAGSNDYQINFVGSTAVVRVPVGFFVSFDGGQTWTDGQVPLGNASFGAGDPSPAFNAKFDTAHMASLGFVCGQGSPICTRGNLQVATSHDGGRTWDRPVTVAKGQGSDVSAQQNFNDKEWLIADNNPQSPYYGRLYLVWAGFRTEKGAYDESPVRFSYSDDAGSTWSKPKVISGSSRQFCTFQEDQNDVDAGQEGQYECDQDQFAYPAVTADGTLYVHFHNEQNAAAWEPGEQFESQIMVVKSVNGGRSWSSPIHVVQMEDSYTGRDYPLNVDGATTLTGHQLRVNPAGNIAADQRPESQGGGRIYIVYADNADGLHDVDEPVTNTNIFLAYSDDGGDTWVGGDDGQTNPATRLRVDATPASDQWYPWAAVDPTDGELKVLYMDGRTDRDLYDITIASSATGAPPFTQEVVSQQPSNPDQSAFFQADVEGCETCATFIGDYNGLDVDSEGRAHGVWTDMRRSITDDGLRAQDAFYARR
jgi:hypothetical protein